MSRANLCFLNISRAVAANISNLNSILLLACWIVGISTLKPENTGPFQVSVLFLLSFCELMYIYIRQFINL